MIDMDTTTKSLCAALDIISVHEELPVVIKYGSSDARIAMKIIALELDKNGQVVIVVEA